MSSVLAAAVISGEAEGGRERITFQMLMAIEARNEYLLGYFRRNPQREKGDFKGSLALSGTHSNYQFGDFLYSFFS